MESLFEMAFKDNNSASDPANPWRDRASQEQSPWWQQTGNAPASQATASEPAVSQETPARPVISTPAAEESPWYQSQNAKKTAGAGAVGVAALAKGAGGIKLLAVLAKLSFLKGFASIAFTIWYYALYYGWVYGVGVVALIFIHEMGHYVIARRHGYGADLPAFRLFMAYVRTHSPPPNATAYDSSMISFAGPVWGGIAGLLCLLAYFATGETLFTALAYFSFFINLINMIPVRPLDGGGIVAALRRPKAAWAGTPYWTYFDLSAAQRWTVGLGYLLTLAALIGMLVITWHLPSPVRAYSASSSSSYSSYSPSSY